MFKVKYSVLNIFSSFGILQLNSLKRMAINVMINLTFVLC